MPLYSIRPDRLYTLRLMGVALSIEIGVNRSLSPSPFGEKALGILHSECVRTLTVMVSFPEQPESLMPVSTYVKVPATGKEPTGLGMDGNLGGCCPQS